MLCSSPNKTLSGSHGRDRMVVGFTTTYAISLSVTCNRSVVFSTNKTDLYDITEILLKVALNTRILSNPPKNFVTSNVKKNTLILSLKLIPSI